MKKTIITISLLTALALVSCGTESTSSEQPATQSTTTASTTEASSEPTTESASEVTTEHATAPQNEVGYEGMTAVSADALNIGNYYISVDSSSSMFKIADCILHVGEDGMTADIIIDSKSYDALFMGTEDEAKNASETIGYTVNDGGQSVFTVPVESLDKEVQCAALSAKKQEWYGRTLVFRADSLPDTAFKEQRYATVSSLSLEDGEYTIEVELDGGSGRATVESPAKLSIKGGKATAEIKWSSDKYDKMVVQELEYTPTLIDGHSVFEIPVIGFDYKIPVSANTTAMSTPHMIEYTLYFASSSIKKCE
ncbi:hypothetical protein SAMN02910353_03003 [Ruminococcus sp. YRD2003]|uniref:hypothetical protein n=1 Tax=Ruminococcus sp. YRD2003 TaxID=1452313 RepID=UPI0008B2236B|nr:hypothetical protein SAMN02910353_03003 [Ruminococcus flavefaciens]